MEMTFASDMIERILDFNDPEEEAYRSEIAFDKVKE